MHLRAKTRGRAPANAARRRSEKSRGAGAGSAPRRAEARPKVQTYGQQTSLGDRWNGQLNRGRAFLAAPCTRGIPNLTQAARDVARQRWPRARNRQRARRVLSWYATRETSKSSFSTSRRCSSASIRSSNPFEFCGRSTTTPRPRTRTCSGSVWRRRSSRSRPTRARSRPRTAWAATTCERRSVEGRRRPYERPRIRATGAAWPSRSSISAARVSSRSAAPSLF